MLFSWPMKYIRLHPSPSSQSRWDSSLSLTDSSYLQKTHTLLCTNCHTHVAAQLTAAGYLDRRWSGFDVWLLTMRESKYVSWKALVCTYLPFVVLVIVVISCYVIVSNQNE